MRKILIFLAMIVFLSNVSVVSAGPWTDWAFSPIEATNCRSHHYGYSNYSHSSRIRSIAPLQGGGYVAVMQDGRVVTVSSSGEIVADNFSTRLMEKSLDWVGVMGTILLVK